MDRRLALAVFRAITAAIVIVALLVQVKLNLDSGLFRPLRFFALFTVLSYTFTAVLWLWLAFRWRATRTRADDLLRGASVLYLVLSLVIVVVLVAGPEIQVGDPRVDLIVRKIFPIVAVIDWLIDPPATDLRLRDVGLWLIFPVVWLGLTLIRGAVDDWYPYRFLDPGPAGYRSVAYYGVTLLAALLVIAGGIIGLGDFGRDRRLRGNQRLAGGR
jgi:hypothetical protein